MKKIVVVFILIFLSSAVKADYQFNNFSASLSNITDSSLSEDIEGKSISTQLSVDIKQSFFVSGSVSVTAYDEKTINTIFIDYAAHSFNIQIGKYQTFKNNNKLFAYLGYGLLNDETVVDTVKISDSESALLYGAGLIAPINQQIDFLVDIGFNTLNDQTNQSIGAGLSFDLDTIAAIEASVMQQDDIKAVSFAIRFNYD